MAISMALVPFVNTLHKPGPIFNFLAASAFKDGADFVYRVNDDSEFTNRWAVRFFPCPLRTLSNPLQAQTAYLFPIS